jgi:hypothetical protein
VSAAPPPTTYAAWQELLDRFRAGADEVLQALEGGRIEWSPVVAERWTRRMSETLGDRLRVLSAQLQRDLERARGDLHGVESALVRTGRGLVPLARFCRLVCAPPEVQSHLLGELESWTRQTRSSLESQASRFRDDQGLLLRAIRSARLDIPGETAGTPGRTTDTESPAVVRGRRILT